MKFKIDLAKEKMPTGDLFGIFFEDLNHAADGGLYAELVQNRSFEFSEIDNPDYNNLTAWEKIENDGALKLIIETGNPVSEKNPHYLALDIEEPGTDVGVENSGWGGICLRENTCYKFTCYAKREQCLEDAVTISLRSKDGKSYAGGDILLTDAWKKYELEFTSPVSEENARLAITARGRGKVYLDHVSLFPADTYKKRQNGLRRDIAELLEKMRPKFMRFPGGCLVHDGSLDPDVRDSMYRWKNTLGSVEARPSRRNNWRYNQTLGLGFFELFQFCEDIGTKPLPVISAGYDPHHRRAVPLAEIKPWVDDALDLIEFANGEPDTKWGSVRAEMGHPSPFNLEYLGIGNEEVGAEFFERFEIIFKAVREKYPEIKIIGTSGPNAAGSEFERGWQSAVKNKVDFVDEHYYQAPEWFLANQHRYDGYSGQNPKVFLGEYASWGNTWYNALTEASFMIGLERNVHVVGLACYAPMLAHANYVNWRPDMIWFDNLRAYGTANYYVQKLFMNYLGKFRLNIETENIPQIEVLSDPERIAGKIFLSNYESDVIYSEISLTDDDTNTTFTFPDCSIGSEDDNKILLREINSRNYTLRLNAKETKGYRGFRIYFGSSDDRNELCWTLGGWQNQDTVIGEKINGRNSDLSQCLLSIEKDRIYRLRLEIRGRNIRTFVDDEAYHETESKPAVIEPLYVSAQESEDSIIIKAVNVSEKACEAEFEIPGGEALKEQDAEIVFMEGWLPEMCNTFDEPALICPSETKIRLNPSSFIFTFPGRSIYIIKFKKDNAIIESC